MKFEWFLVRPPSARGEPNKEGGRKLKARLAKELVVRVPNEIGVLAQLSKIVADKGINILAVSAWVEGADAVVRLLTSDNLHVLDTFRNKKLNIRESDVVVTEAAHKPGMLRHLAEKLAAQGIDLYHLYATAPADQDKSLVVFSSTNNDRAVVLLNEKPA